MTDLSESASSVQKIHACTSLISARLFKHGGERARQRELKQLNKATDGGFCPVRMKAWEMLDGMQPLDK